MLYHVVVFPSLLKPSNFTPPGSQDSPGGEAKDSAFLSSRDTDLLEQEFCRNDLLSGWNRIGAQSLGFAEESSLCVRLN